MDKDLIYSKLTTKKIGKNIILYDIIDSTQDEIKRKKDLKEGTVIVSELQTKGKGTHGRVWYTDSFGKNIAFTLVLYPQVDVNRLDGITIVIAKCVIKTFKTLYNIDLQIKYPNDIVCNLKKIGGILTQTTVQNSIVKKLYIGIGINILQEEFNENIQNIATSIKKEFNIECKREDIISTFFNFFEEEYLKIVGEFNE